MGGCDNWAWFKAFEVVLCGTCLAYNWWTNERASRLFFFLEKQSREWPLLKNVTWNQTGSWIAVVTFGGYVIITLALLVAHVVGDPMRKTEIFLLGIGAALYLGVGCMILSSFDAVHEDLFDNAIILGFLAIFTGLIFILDVGCLRRRENGSRTRMGKRSERLTPPPSPIREKDPPPVEKVITELRSSMKEKEAWKGKQRNSGSLFSPFKSRNTGYSKGKENGASNGKENGALKGKENGDVGRVKVVRAEEAREVPATRVDVQKLKSAPPLSWDVPDGISRHVERDNEYDEQSIVTYEKEIQRRKRDEFLTGGKIVKSRTTDAGTSPMPGREAAGTQTTLERHYVVQNPVVTSTRKSVSSEEYTVQETLTGRRPITPLPPLSSLASSTSTSSQQPVKSAKYANGFGAVPNSPTDPGYVLHTAAKWQKPQHSPTYTEWKRSNGAASPV